MIGGDAIETRWDPKTDSLGFDFGIPDDSPYYAINRCSATRWTISSANRGRSTSTHGQADGMKVVTADAEAAVVAARAACEAHQHYRDALLSGAVGALREAGHARRLATRALIRHLVEVMA